MRRGVRGNRIRRRSGRRSALPLTVSRFRQHVKRLPADRLFPLDQWHRDQKTHWLRWLSTFESAQPAARVYNAIQCPHMLVYLAWALDIDRERLGRAIRMFPFDPKELDRNCGRQCRQVRALFPWPEIEARLSRARSVR